MTRVADLRAEVAGARWYHAMELPGGIRTPGDYDLVDAVRRIPFPEGLAGKRCLDVGTRDGFWAFEMERRGAAEVVAIDLPSMADVDLPEPRPALPDETRASLSERESAFDIAHRALGSRVEWRALSAYDLDPAAVGTFDFAFVGTLLLHLRNPVDALARVRSVLEPNGRLMSNNPISVAMTLLRPHAPAAEIVMRQRKPYFYVPNARGHARMVEAAGFEVESSGRPYLMRYGPGWKRRWVYWREGDFLQALVQRRGAPHTCVVGRPAGPAASG